MATGRGRVVRVVLALYPASVRDRYGAEIADLLSRSSTPRRDLADVAWCALLDRGATLSLRPVLTPMGLLAVPFVIGVVLLTAAGVAVTGLGVAEGLGYRVGADAGRAVTAASVVPVLVGAVWVARRVGRSGRVVAPGVVVPVTLALGTAALASLPYLGEALGETRSATLLASLFWCATTTVLAAGCAALVRRVGSGAAWLVTVSGGLVVLELCCAVYVLLVHRAYGLSPSTAWTAYPAVVSGRFGDPAGQVAEALKGLPALLTVCTAVTLTLVVARARRRPTVDATG